MTNDSHILAGLLTRHERMTCAGEGKVELSFAEQALNITEYIHASQLDVEPPTWDKMKHYLNRLPGAVRLKCFTKLNEAAEELR